MSWMEKEFSSSRIIALFVTRAFWSVPGIMAAALLGAVASSDSQTKAFDEPVETAMLPVPRDTRYSLTNGRSLTIVVLNEEDGKPVPGADVTGASYVGNFPERTPPAKTDALGKARIRLGEPASNKRWQAQQFRVSVRSAGFDGKGMMWLNRGEDPRGGLPDEVTVKLARGETIGGVVRNAQGKGLAGVRVTAQGSSYQWGDAEAYSQISVGDDESAIVTDANGRWEIAGVSKDLNRLRLGFRRPDGSITTFSNEDRSGSMFDRRYELFEVTELRAKTAVFVLKDGFTVRGVVVDLSGVPIPNVLVKEGYGMSRPQVVNQFRTDAKGRFELRNRSRREMILTAEPENYTIGSTVVPVGPDTPLATITVHPMSPLRIRVTDQDGKPVRGARISPDYRNPSDGVWPRLEGMILDFEAETDESGVATWKNAPVANLILTAQSDALGTVRTVSFDAAATRDVTIQVRPGAEKEFFIRVKATEEGSTKPVSIDRVLLITGSHENDEAFATPKQSEFTMAFPIEKHWKGPGFGGCRFRFEAKGYAPVIAPEKGSRDFNAGDWTLDLKLRPAAKPSGWVLLEDGTPANGAVIVSSLNNSSFPLLQDGGKLYTDERHARATADANGYFELMDIGTDRAVLISHEKGFAETRTGILRSQPRLTLQPWGKVEGVLRLGNKPDANTRLHLGSGTLQGREEDYWSAGLSSMTDAEGRFTFEKVPPGLNWISRHHKALTYKLAVEVKPGQTTQIEDGGKGRMITAKVPSVYDWTSDAQVLTVPFESGSFPHWDDYASRASMDKAAEEYRRRASVNQNSRSYPALIEKDGTVRIYDVAPGRYELRLKVTEAPKNEVARIRRRVGLDTKTLASLTREVIVPPDSTDEPLDLGELEIISQRTPQRSRAISPR